MWRTSLVETAAARLEAKDYTPVPPDLKVKCLELVWFRDINKKLRKSIGGGHLQGEDYFEGLYDRMAVDDWELEGFMQRVFKVLTMILMEQGNVHKLEKSLIFKIDKANGSANAYRKDTNEPLRFELRDYEVARQLFWESELFNESFNIGKGTSEALYKKALADEREGVKPRDLVILPAPLEPSVPSVAQPLVQESPPFAT